MTRRPRVAVVGHTEWVTHCRGPMPRPGRITHLVDPLDEPGGGGAVAAAQVALLGADCLFLTALGEDALGERAARELADLGVDVRAAPRPTQTRALSSVDADGDRAIAVVGERHHPEPGDPLPWDQLGLVDAVYATGRDAQVLRLCRRAPVLVVMGRRWRVLAESGVACDVLVGSANDPEESPPPGAITPAPRVVVATDGTRGGEVRPEGGPAWRWQPQPPPGPAVDSYGCGDAFAAGLTVGLAGGAPLAEAVALAARCGASAVTGRGGLAGLLRR